jgi:hypothetical protein
VRVGFFGGARGRWNRAEVRWKRRVKVCLCNVLGSFRETALIVEAGITGGYLPARV